MAAQVKPNILFISCDNIGRGAFGCPGGGTPTPRIDRLAGEASGSTTTRWRRLLAGLPGTCVLWLAPTAACDGAKDDLDPDPEDDQVGDHLPGDQEPCSL